MALVPGKRSTLNPNAPLFIPAAVRQVEDFSPEWWQLVTTSTWYRDYWINQHEGEDGFYENGDNDLDSFDLADLLPASFDFDAGEDLLNAEPEFDAQFESQSYHPPYAALENDFETACFLASLEETGPKSLVEPAKYSAKPAKWVNPRCSPRNIHQPR